MRMAKRASARAFTDEERIAAFERVGARLLRSRYARRQKWKVSFAPGVRSTLPSQETLRAFLIDFRQIYLLQGEPCHIAPIYNAALNVLRDSEIREKVRQLARHTRTARYGPFMTVTADGQHFKPRELVEAWVSHWFHADNPNPLLDTLGPRRRTFLQIPMFFLFHFCIQEVRILLDLISEGRRRDGATKRAALLP